MASLPPLEFVIKAVDQASKPLDDVKRKVGETNNEFKDTLPTLIGYSAAMAGIVAVSYKAITSFAEEEVKIAKLNDALKTAGTYSAEYSEMLVEQAKAIGMTTRFTHDQALSMEQLLATYGLAGPIMDRTMKATLDLAETMGKDAEGAAFLMAKAVEGNTGMLKRWGITVDENLPPAKRFMAVLDAIEKKMGGRAEVAGATLSGAFAQAKDAASGFFEALGSIIAKGGIFENTIRGMTGMLRELTSSLEGPTKAKTKAFLLMQEEALGAQIQFQEKVNATTKPDEHDAARAAALEKLKAQHKAISEEIHKQYVAEQAVLKVTNDKSEAALKLVYKKQAEEEWTKKNTEALKEQKDVYRQIQNIIEQRTAASSAVAEQKKIADMIRQGDEQAMKDEAANLLLDRNNVEAHISALKNEADLLNNQKAAHLDRMKAIEEDLRVSETKAAKDQQFINDLDEALTRLQSAKFDNVTSMFTGAAGGNLGAVGQAVGMMQGGAGSLAASSAGMYSMILMVVQQVAKALPNLLSGIFSAGMDIAKNISKGFTTGFGLIPYFQDLVSGPSIYKSIGAAVAGELDRADLHKTLRLIQQGIMQTAEGFMTLPERLSNIQAQNAALQGPEFSMQIGELFKTIGVVNRIPAGTFKGVQQYAGYWEEGNLADYVKQGGKHTGSKDVNAANIGFNIQDPAAYKAALEALGAQMKEQAQGIMDEAQLKIEEQQLIQDAVQKTIDTIKAEITRLTQARDTMRQHFGEIIDTVKGGLQSPEQTVAILKEQFASATGEDKAKIGEKLGNALEAQWNAAQKLAEQGAISGEELKSIQTDILSQLQDAEAATTSVYDQMLSVQQAQLDVQQKSFDAIQATIDGIKSEAKAQVKILSDLYNEMYKENADLSKIIKLFTGLPTYAQGTNYVPNTGPALLHKGETVVPAGMAPMGFTININGIPSGMGKSEIAKAVRDVLRENIGNIRGSVKKAVNA